MHELNRRRSCAQVSKKLGAPDLISRAARCCYSFLSGQLNRKCSDSSVAENHEDVELEDERDSKRAKVGRPDWPCMLSLRKWVAR